MISDIVCSILCACKKYDFIFPQTYQIVNSEILFFSIIIYHLEPRKSYMSIESLMCIVLLCICCEQVLAVSALGADEKSGKYRKSYFDFTLTLFSPTFSKKRKKLRKKSSQYLSTDNLKALPSQKKMKNK